MSDSIRRKDAIDVIDEYDFEFPDYMERFVMELRDAMKADLKRDIEELPSAQPKRGRWEEREHFTNDEWSIDEWQIERCSECNKYLTTPYRYYFFHHNYCPYCGARMEDEHEVD